MNTIVRDEGVKDLHKGLLPILLGYFHNLGHLPL